MEAIQILKGGKNALTKWGLSTQRNAAVLTTVKA